MRFLLLFLAVLAISFEGFAQVAAPSLDPSQNVDLPSVTPWRHYHTGAINYGKGTHESESGDEGDFIVNGGMLALSPGEFGLEAYIQTFNYEGTHEENGFTVDDTMLGNTSQVGISYLFSDFWSIGIAQFSETEKNEGKSSGVTQYKEESKNLATKIGVNIRLADIFFLGGGLNSFTNTGSVEDASGDRQEIDWQETVIGAAILTGDPGQFQFKAEYHIKTSPEVTSEADEQKSANGHKKTDSGTAIVELSTGLYFISYKTETVNEAEIDKQYLDHGNGEMITTINTIGIGYINDKGLLLTLYSEDQTETEKAGDEDKESKLKSLVLNIGYNF